MSEQQQSYPVSRRGFLGGVIGGAAVGATAGAGQAAAHHTRLRSCMRTDRQWSEFLSAQDLIWKRPPRYWFDAPFLGNGRIGTMLYQRPGTNVLQLDVHHSEVHDHRPQFGSTWGLARLPIGHFTLDTVGAVTGVDLRLDLWNAELRGTVTTTAGTLEILVAAVNDRSVLVASLKPSAGERGYRWTFHPAEAVSPRIKFQPIPTGYTGNPPPETSTDGDVNLVTQPLLSGGEHVTAYRRHRDTLYVAVAHSDPEKTSAPRATAAVRRASALPVSALLTRHRRWWHDFYRRSFLSIPDQRLQSFYWIQLYKIAAATREDAPVMATPGPWLQDTPWPAVWWNLNAQLEYWLIYGSNHLELDAITRTLSENRQRFVDALPAQYRADSMGIPRTTDMNAQGGTVGVPGKPSPTPELGNFTWALHNVWLTYRHTMDDDLLRDTLFPMLRKAINYYLHFLTPGADGKLHLAATFSPEYGELAPDCNYDLALIRWGCTTLLDAARRLGVDDPLKARWQEVLRDLVPYPVDANGYMIGAGVPFAKSHRHYSHLLMVYPLYEVTTDRDLIERSLRHWISFEGALQGYSFTGAASISALLGKGNDALGYLGELLRRFIKPNTMYQEAGPVIETPLSAAQSVHEMLVQSWGSIIRIFPAVPDAWRDVTVHDFQTEGAFTVSAVRSKGVTQFVRVRSDAGEPCRVRPGIAGRLAVRGEHGPVRWRDAGDGVIEIDLDRDDEVLIYRAGTRPDFVIAPVPISAPGTPWGLQPLPPVGETVPLDLKDQFNNDGISPDGNRSDGNFDGAGFTYPAEDLPPAGPVTYDGVPFVFPSAADGVQNNVVARRQVLAVPAGKYAKLRILGAGGGGNVRTTATATYADGTTGDVLIELSNWTGAPYYHEAEILRTRRRHGPPPTGGDAANAAIFHQVTSLDPSRELRSITLPNQSRLHLFALTLERP